ncbi:hypothetical protein [Nitratireductor pacificus]|uniref:Uncharacterized protein n=1 Tax=Nitratireductor pacificus pht-3B TaxID=391937 RepID=K2LGH3_9HYPH|nr:hypothetical protein [Nitratireductor pacificus]EKF16869.1 hypothetical protein NA2_20861 [Nitratireductor pacificus pht-3B]
MTIRIERGLRCAVAAIGFLASCLPAGAQWGGAGEWGPAGHTMWVEPGTWMVTFPDQGDWPSVAASAEGQNHTGRLEFSCRRGAPSGNMMLWDYHGSALAVVPRSHPEETRQDVVFDFDGKTFDVTLTFVPWDRVWLAQGLLTSRFLEAFASSRRLEIRSLDGEQVNIWGLKGTRKARQSMRQVCES